MQYLIVKFLSFLYYSIWLLFLHTCRFWYNSDLTRSDNKVYVSNQKVETWIPFLILKTLLMIN